jgi:hypothetical protein
MMIRYIIKIFIIMILASLVMECDNPGPGPDPPFVCCTPNPSSHYCSGLGYTVDVREDENGQYGMCIFPDGSECHEWEFFYGACGQQYSFCNINGGQIETDTNCTKFYSSGGKCGICNLQDGTQCLEYDYFNGNCP